MTRARLAARTKTQRHKGVTQLIANLEILWMVYRAKSGVRHAINSGILPTPTLSVARGSQAQLINFLLLLRDHALQGFAHNSTPHNP